MSRVVVHHFDELDFVLGPVTYVSPTTAKIDADDTPSRHPCKIRITPSRGDGHRFDPYRAAVVSLAGALEQPRQGLTIPGTGAEEDEEEEEVPSIPSVATTTPTQTPPPNLLAAPTVPVKYVTVQFKRLRDTFFVPQASRSGLALGHLVVVEGDRGENIGEVVEDRTAIHHRHMPIAGRVLRQAGMEDTAFWREARQRERDATVRVQQLASEHAPRMMVADTEFQADGNKLTVYYRTSDGRPVDFRKLQRVLFRVYRCRIWLVDETHVAM